MLLTSTWWWVNEGETQSGGVTLPLVRSETRVGRCVETSLYFIDLIQFNGEPRETIVQIGVDWQCT